jgi:hypothetical protein
VSLANGPQSSLLNGSAAGQGSANANANASHKGANANANANGNASASANGSLFGLGGGNGGIGGAGLPGGIQLINGIPCGPDGTPLTGAAATQALAMLTSSGSISSSGSGSPKSSSASHGSQRAASQSRTGREHDQADRKDLYWQPHTMNGNQDGRLYDH